MARLAVLEREDASPGLEVPADYDIRVARWLKRRRSARVVLLVFSLIWLVVIAGAVYVTLYVPLGGVWWSFLNRPRWFGYNVISALGVVVVVLPYLQLVWTHLESEGGKVSDGQLAILAGDSVGSVRGYGGSDGRRRLRFRIH